MAHILKPNTPQPNPHQLLIYKPISTQKHMEEKRLCITCKEFLPIDKFKPGIKRSICRMHYNISHRKAQQEKKSQIPGRLQSSTAWQMALTDAQKVFNTRMTLKPSEVRAVLASCPISSQCKARFVPLDPNKPLSLKNFCLISSDTRKEMCNAWRMLKSTEIYAQFLSAGLGREIYATPASWKANAKA